MTSSANTLLILLLVAVYLVGLASSSAVCTLALCTLYASPPSLVTSIKTGLLCGNSVTNPCTTGADIVLNINGADNSKPLQVIFVQSKVSERIVFCGNALGSSASKNISWIGASKGFLKLNTVQNGSFVQVDSACGSTAGVLFPSVQGFMFSIQGIAIVGSNMPFIGTSSTGSATFSIHLVSVFGNVINSLNGVFMIQGSCSVLVNYSNFEANYFVPYIAPSEKGNVKGKKWTGQTALSFPSGSLSNNGLIFSFTGNGMNVTLANNVFSNNTGMTGVIFSSASFTNITLSNVTFNSIVMSSQGGCINIINTFWISMDQIVVLNISAPYGSFFMSQSATGGIMYLQNFNSSMSTGTLFYVSQLTELVLRKSKFEFCSSRSSLGGCFELYKVTSIVISETKGFSNQASKGGFLFVSDTASITIDTSTFDGQGKFGSANGGALFFQRIIKIVVNASSFMNHYSQNCLLGGAIYAADSHLSISNSSFTRNSCAFGSGGSIFLTGSSNLILENSYFLFGTALSGGNIFLSSLGSVQIINSIFSNANADSGGCVCIQNRISLFVKISSFIGCYSNNIGGAFAVLQSSNISIYDSSFSGNSAFEAGGDIYILTQTVWAQFIGCQFENSLSKKHGGSIYAKTDILAVFPISIRSCSFKNCNSMEGACLKISRFSVEVSDSSYSDSKSAFSIISLDSITDSSQKFTFHNSMITNCSTYESSSAAITSEQNTLINISSSNFSDCKSSGLSSASIIRATRIEIYGSRFFRNQGISAEDNRGCIYVLPSIYAIYVVNSSFADNSIENGYCSLICTESSLFVFGTLFMNNSVTSKKSQYGASIYIENVYALSEISNSQFKYNAGIFGASVFVSFSRLNISGCVFQNEMSSKSGGSLFISGESYVQISDSLFQNISSNSAGVISATDLSRVFIKACTFNESSAYEKGGSIVLDGFSSMNITDSFFVKNHARSGGAIYGASSSLAGLNISNVQFFKNWATSDGDSLCVSSIGAGGALYLQNSNLLVDLTKSSFIENVAEHFGGAIGFSDAPLNIDVIKTGTYLSNKAVYGLDYGSLIIQQDYFPSNGIVNNGTMKDVFLVDIRFRDLFNQTVTGLSNCRIKISYRNNFSGYSTFPLAKSISPSLGSIVSLSISNPTTVTLSFILRKFNLSTSNISSSSTFPYIFKFLSEDFNSLTEAFINVRICNNDEILYQTISTTLCQKCPKGAIVEGNKCHFCDAGFYQIGQICEKCELGRFASDPGSEVCSPCFPGRYAENHGATFCMACPVGAFQNSSGNSFCDQCFDLGITDTLGSVNASECKCPEGFYGSNFCTKCKLVEGLECSSGSPLPYVKKGWFRNVDDPSLTRRCIISEACLESGFNSSSSCVEGFTGMACGSCIEGYFWKETGCQACGNSTGLLFLSLFFMFLVLYLSFRIGFSHHKEAAPADVKVAIASIQIIASYPRLSKKWPSFLSGVFSALNIFNFNFRSIGPSCIFGGNFWNYYYVEMFSPILFIFLVYIGAHIFNFAAVKIQSFKAKRSTSETGTRGFRADVKSKLIHSFVFLITSMYTFLSVNAFKPFQCMNQPDGTTTLEPEPSLYCYDTLWYSNLASVTLICLVMVVIIPASLFSIVYVNRTNLQSKAFLSRYATLVESYTDKFYWFEIYHIAKKTLFAVIMNSLSNFQLAEKTYYVSMFLIICLVIENVAKPYRFKEVNGISTIWNLISVLWLITLPIIFEQRDSEEHKNQTYYFVMSLIAVLVCAALFIVGRVVIRKLQESRENKKEKKLITNFKPPTNDSTILLNLSQNKLSIRSQLDEIDKDNTQSRVRVKSTIAITRATTTEEFSVDSLRDINNPRQRTRTATTELF